MKSPGGEGPTARSGIGYAIAAYGAWAIFPLFWKLLVHVDALELVAHRIVWASGVYLALLAIRGRLPELAAAFRGRTAVAAATGSGVLLGLNWLAFIHAVETDRVLHASLGYFLTPLVSIVLGAAFLHERMRPGQWIALAFAAAGVAQLAAAVEGLPWIALVLAFSFGGYGLIRKVAPTDALVGSAAESLVLAPIAAGWLVALAIGHGGAMGRDGATDLLLLSTGLVTAVPLLWFSRAARALPLRTLGFLQYLAPSGQLVVATMTFGEPFSPVHARSFACIWTAVAIFTAESWLRTRGSRS